MCVYTHRLKKLREYFNTLELVEWNMLVENIYWINICWTNQIKVIDLQYELHSC